MRKKKQQRLREERLWGNLFAFSVPKGVDVVPQHLNRVNFRICGVDDFGLELMATVVKTINMLDLDDTNVTNAGIETLTNIEDIKELRLKECRYIDAGCVPFLNKLAGLTLLHLGSTAIVAGDILGLDALVSLKTLLISSAGYEAEEADFAAIKKMLPNCELLIDHKVYGL